MPNTYFDFKQFRVDQGQSGMKVTTEGCILGAWASAMDPQRILDIGAGTGLLALMMAQKHPQATIDAVELEPHAAAEAKANFANSPWASRLSLHAISIQEYGQVSAGKYDLIVCNPPFFGHAHRSQDTRKAQATHRDQLSIPDLVDALLRLLHPTGEAFVLYPLSESQEAQRLIEGSPLAVVGELLIYDQADKPIFRRVLKIGHQRTASGQASDTLVIKKGDGTYTSAFIQLLKPYYLHL